MAAITLLLSSDTGPVSRGVINTNFTNVNNELTTANSDIDAAQTDIDNLEATRVLKSGDTMTGQLKLAKGADIASATTTDLGAATGNYVDVTGTTTITGLGTVAAGTTVVVRFTGILTLTYNATSLILPTGASITTIAGDTAQFTSLGSGNWRCVWYQRGDGTSLGIGSVNGLTEDTTGDMDADFALVYDNSAGANRKQKVNVFRASDAEALAGTVTNKFITPKQANDNYGLAFNFLASDNLRASADTTRAMGSETSYTKFKEIQLPTNSGTGTIRVKFLRTYTSGNALQTTVYVNGVAVPATAESSTTTATRSYDISASPGGLIQLYAFQAGGIGDGSVANFRVYYDNTPKSPSNGTTILD